MRTTNGYLTNLVQRLGTLGLVTLILLGIVLVLVTGLIVASAADLVEAGSDSIRVAPLRWLSHRC